MLNHIWFEVDVNLFVHYGLGWCYAMYMVVDVKTTEADVDTTLCPVVMIALYQHIYQCNMPIISI